jgi:four helix bundle protein
MNPMFDHEKLEVYQESLRAITWLEPLLEKLPKSISVRDQLDRASTSIPLNIAEGNGKFLEKSACGEWFRCWSA